MNVLASLSATLGCSPRMAAPPPGKKTVRMTAPGGYERFINEETALGTKTALPTSLEVRVYRAKPLSVLLGVVLVVISTAALVTYYGAANSYEYTRSTVAAIIEATAAVMGESTKLFTEFVTPGTDEACEDGLFLRGPLPSRANLVLYLIGLMWSFMGVAIAADVFMMAIEQITSQTITKMYNTPDGTVRPYTAHVWNATIANLSLMALGSSAPEILLSLIEIFSSGFYSGALGPSTIVGSAAFNMLGITAVCVVAVPAGQTRFIKEQGVFMITAFFSVFAYLWLYIILAATSPNVVEVWEGLVTLLLFPLLLSLAYAADVRFCAPTVGSSSLVTLDKQGKPVSKQDLAKAVAALGDPTTADDSTLSAAVAHVLTPSSRAVYRVAGTRGMIGGKEHEVADAGVAALLARRGHTDPADSLPSVSCAVGSLRVAEGAKYAVVPVTVEGRSGTSAISVLSVRYRTRASDTPGVIAASAGEDYVHTEGTLRFGPLTSTQQIFVPLIDDDKEESDEVFAVELLEPVGCALGAVPSCDVTIEDDDAPGLLSFVRPTAIVSESDGKYHAVVKRGGGSRGRVTVEYRTLDGTALASADYIAQSGTLTFGDGEIEKVVTVPLIDDDRYEADESFQIELSEPSGGATFSDDSDGFPDRAVATITIRDNTERRKTVDSLAVVLDLNVDEISLTSTTWSGQLAEAIEFEGGGCSGVFLYLLALPWKLIFALVPPPRLCNGWACFLISLVGIGILTALIGDLAGQMGCCMGLLPSVTATTFVALGTSLPDTFASMQAAQKEMYADSSIGNITGSNSVNVFLGLGLPWAAAALYWAYSATEADHDTWRLTYSKEPWYVEGMQVAFAVPAGDLGFSVAVFCVAASTCLGTLLVRRCTVGGELGGPAVPKYGSALFFVFLWVVYVALSSGAAYGYSLAEMIGMVF